jgi:hypothetical protein
MTILMSGCAKSSVIDSYCASMIPMRGYLWLEDKDPELFNEIHTNNKRFVARCLD